jgi:hypothetical protein
VSKHIPSATLIRTILSYIPSPSSEGNFPNVVLADADETDAGQQPGRGQQDRDAYYAHGQHSHRQKSRLQLEKTEGVITIGRKKAQSKLHGRTSLSCTHADVKETAVLCKV